MGRTRHEADLTHGRKQLRELICLLRRAVVEKGKRWLSFCSFSGCCLLFLLLLLLVLSLFLFLLCFLLLLLLLVIGLVALRAAGDETLQRVKSDGFDPQ